MHARIRESVAQRAGEDLAGDRGGVEDGKDEA